MWIIVKLKFSLRVLLSICSIFANFSLALLIKLLPVKKRAYDHNGFYCIDVNIMPIECFKSSIA